MRQLEIPEIRNMSPTSPRSGGSIASVDPKTPKLIDGACAEAATKLSIIDSDGNDIHAKVSGHITELTITLNSKINFWKADNPYIRAGYIFNGSSQFLMDPTKIGSLVGIKSSFGDIDVIIPKEKLAELTAFLDSIDDNQIAWKSTNDNSLTDKFSYVGRTKSFAAIPDQLVTLWYYHPAKQVVQIDFEGDTMEIDSDGFEKPSEWTKFSKDSPWDDLCVGIKGLAGALMLRSLTRAATRLDKDVIVLTTMAGMQVKSGQTVIGRQITKDVRHTLPSTFTLNTGGGGAGIRKAYEFVGAVFYNGNKVNAYRFVEAKETKPEDRIIDVSKIYEVVFGVAPSRGERASFRSFQGLLKSMKKHLDSETIRFAVDRFAELLEKEPLELSEREPIANAVKEIIGITI